MKKEDNIEDRSYCVYVHTNKVNGKKYVGQTCQQPPENRWKRGLGYTNSKYFYRSIKKYGWDNFDSEIISDSLTKEEADELEIKLIDKLNTHNPHGYNSRGGGSNGKLSEEHKKNISKANAGRTMSDEARKNMHDARIRHLELYGGGKQIDQYSKDGVFIKTWNSIADASRALGVADGTISVCCNGTGKSAAGYIWRNHGDEITQEYLNWCNTHNSFKKVNQYSRDGKLIKTWDSISEAEKATNICGTGISGCCRNNNKIAGGYLWRYYGDEITDEYIAECNAERQLSEEGIKRIKEANKKSVHKRYKKVDQYSKDGEFIKTWDCIKNASQELSICNSSITECCQGKRKTVGGYIWKYNGDELTKEYIEQCNTKAAMSDETKQKIASANFKKINQYSRDGEFIKTWDSMIEAAKQLNLRSTSGMRQCCKGQRNHAGGYVWKYCEN